MRTDYRIVLILFIFVFSCTGTPRAHEETISQDRHLAEQIESIKPGIVAVGTYYFNDIPKIRYLGTGFVIKNTNRVVTNYHVISSVLKDRKQALLKIFHKDFPQKGRAVRVAATDLDHDLAILSAKGSPIPGLVVSDSRKVKEGWRVIFTGYPIGLVLGLNPTTHTGIISSIAPLILPSPSARLIDGDLIHHLSEPYEVFQLDATAYPGNSGSPVCLADTGEVIGVINQVFVKGKKEHALQNPSGITYAIPSRFIRQLEKTMPK